MARLFDDAQSEYLGLNQAVLSAYPLAMVAWFNTDISGVAQNITAITDKDDTVAAPDMHRLVLGSNPDTRPVVAQTSQAGTYSSALSTTPFSLNIWHHGCAIFVSATDRRAFIDGGSKGTEATNVTPTGLDYTAIGTMKLTTITQCMSGHIAEVAIYDLTNWPGATNAEKANNFEKILPSLAKGFSPLFFPLGLVAYWPLIRGLNDKIKSQNLTAYGTVVSPHVKIIYPINSFIGKIIEEVKLSGSSDETSSVSGFLNLQLELVSSSVGISNVSVNLNIITQLQGSSAGASVCSASLDSQPKLVSSSTGISGVFAFLDLQLGLIGSSIGTSVCLVELDVTTQLQGFSAGASVCSASLLKAIQLQSFSVGISTCIASLLKAIQLQGFINGISTLLAEFDVTTQLQGFSAGISNTLSSLHLIAETINLISSSVGISNINGSLLVSTELGSSLIEISGVSASLGSVEVLTLLSASSYEVSSINGWLGFLIFIDGSTNEISNILATNLDKQPGCEGLTAGISTLLSYLSLIPDFEAMTLFWRPQDNILETLEWNTHILKAHDGTEQRIKVRQSPRQYFKLRIILETNKLNTQFDSIIHTWQKQKWLIPIWTEYEVHSGNINQHDTVIEIDTTNADFRNNSKAIIWKSSTEYEVIVIDSKTDSQLNLSYSILNNFTGIKYIIPIRTAYLITSSNKERYNSEYSIIDLVFAIYDNINLENYTSEMDYDGLIILNIPSFMEETHIESSDGDIIITDFETGIFKVESDSNFNILTQNHIFFNDTKEACWNFRKFLHSINGRQKIILIPTFRNDVIQTSNIGVLDTSVKIENIKLVENMGFNFLRTYIGFYFSDGTLIVRKITAITEIDSLEEQINFDDNLHLSSIVIPGDCKICFVDKCRLASDRVEIQWPYAHRNECRTNFMRVT